MEYVAPQLSLIGHASGVVLGSLSPFDDNVGGAIPQNDTASLEAEW